MTAVANNAPVAAAAEPRRGVQMLRPKPQPPLIGFQWRNTGRRELATVRSWLGESYEVLVVEAVDNGSDGVGAHVVIRDTRLRGASQTVFVNDWIVQINGPDEPEITRMSDGVVRDTYLTSGWPVCPSEATVDHNGVLTLDGEVFPYAIEQDSLTAKPSDPIVSGPIVRLGMTLFVDSFRAGVPRTT